MKCDHCGQCADKPVNYDLHEKQIVANDPNLLLHATKIIFTNQGVYAVWVGFHKVMPGDSYKLDVDAPHKIYKNFNIRFEVAPETVTSNRLFADQRFLLIQWLNPIEL